MTRFSVLGLLVLAGAAAALAAARSGYSVHVYAPKKVKAGAPFDVVANGTAKKRSVVNVWLDASKCAASPSTEGQRDVYRTGDSYFFNRTVGGGQGSTRVTYSSLPEKGSFHEVAHAHAGTRAGKQYICAYVNVLGASTPKPRARRLRTYAIG